MNLNTLNLTPERAQLIAAGVPEEATGMSAMAPMTKNVLAAGAGFIVVLVGMHLWRKR